MSVSFGKSTVSVSQSVGKSMVASNFGLSLFDRPLDRQNRDAVCTYLRDLPHQIVAIWICARPVNGISDDYGYEHWCVKIQAPPCLISIDFLESDSKGKFGLSVTTAMVAELQDFLMYFVLTDSGRQRMKWRIVSSVTPSPLANKNYKPEYLDPFALSTLKKYMKTMKKSMKNNKKQNVVSTENDGVILKKIVCKKKVNDIADFLDMWTQRQVEHKNKNKKKMKVVNKDKPYNAVTHNCQQFALHLFKWLVNANYPQKVKEASEQTQGPE